MTDFKLLCCKLFEQYPLCNYRIEQMDNEPAKLNVLIIGSGNRVEPILHEVLMMGQLMDTDLDITVATPNSKSFVEKTLAVKAPYLKDFARIILDSKPISDPPDDSRLCTLRVNKASLSIESIELILEKNFDCSYVIISTGKDEVNRAIAEACSRHIPDSPMLIAYVQRKVIEEIEAVSPEMMTVVPFGYGKTEKYRGQLERVAFNIHYGYSQNGNERKTIDEIRHEFEDPYAYLSCFEAALHIKSKLACVGVIDEDPAVAAENFSKLMADKPEIIERLSIVEHSRWIMSKILDGYRPMDDINLIYHSKADTHCKEEGNKWHCCLVPCDKSGNSRITAEDWAASDEGRTYRTDLDALDVMTLNIHRKCGELAASRSSDISTQIDMLRTSLTNNNSTSAQTLQTLECLESSIVQMGLKKKTIIPIYRQHYKKLRELITEECGSNSAVLLDILTVIDSALAPLREFIIYKDYKYQDRLLVQQIPHALTKNCQPTLIKLLSNKETDNLLSAWQMEPEKLIYIGSAENISELRQIHAISESMADFISKLPLLSDVTYYICVPQSNLSAFKFECEFFDSRNHTIIPVPEWNTDGIVEALSGIIGETKIDYLDVTGGNPIITRAAESVASARGFGVIYSHSGRLRNLFNAEEIEYFSPQKSLTVREMFDISGAVLRESESNKKSNLMMRYDTLWKIASKNSQCWDSFCTLLTNAHKYSQNIHFRFAPSKTASGEEVIQITDVASAISALMPMVNYIKKYKYVRDISVTSAFGNQRTLSMKVNRKKVNPIGLKRFFSDCCNHYHPCNYFSHHQDNGCLKFTYVNLNVSLTIYSKPDDQFGTSKEHLCEASPKSIETYKGILNSFSSQQLILDYQYWNPDDSSFECSFRFASRDVLTCMQTSGTILEYFIYYSALLDSDFTDVDMGYEFAHTASADSAQNEIDVICTKGCSSLFISAKMISKESLDSKLNYILYEILHLADRFGINAKAVLAAPSYSQFKYDGNKRKFELNDKIRGALQRGVYVLGAECFTNGKLGQVLNNIMDGNEDWCDCVKPN